MADHANSPTAPRPPTADESKHLADWLHAYGYMPDDAASIAASAYIAVYDSYQTGGPGYCGKLMSVVFDGRPSFFDVFTWRDGTMERCGREYDETECSRCGRKNASLCYDCWKARGRT